MAITSYSTFVDNLHAVSLTGVVRATRNPPDQLNETDLPWRFLRMPSGAEKGLTADANGGWPTLRAEMVVLIEQVSLDTQPTNFDTSVTMMDTIAAALRSTQLAKSKNIWETRLDQVYVANTVYWALVTSVEANG